MIIGWPCQGHTQAGRGEGLRDPRSHVFWEMLQVLRHLQMNQVGQPRMALPTFVSFLTSHAYREGGPKLVWDICSQWLV